jgi:hypothetical protein
VKYLWIFLVVLGVFLVVSNPYSTETSQEPLGINPEVIDTTDDEYELDVDFVCVSLDGHDWSYVITDITGGVQEAMDSGVIMKWIVDNHSYETTWPRTASYYRDPAETREVTLVLYRDGEAVSAPVTRTYETGTPYFLDDATWRLWNIWDYPEDY